MLDLDCRKLAREKQILDLRNELTSKLNQALDAGNLPFTITATVYDDNVTGLSFDVLEVKPIGR